MSNIFEKYVIICVFEENEESLYKNLFQYFKNIYNLVNTIINIIYLKSFFIDN